MFSKTAAAAFFLFALSSAAPSSPSTTWYHLDQNARFDNAQGIPLVAAAPINIYLDILWNGMSLVETQDTSKLAGVQLQSAPNCAAYSALDAATVLQGQPSMRTVYQDSTIDHFDLSSFYFGCVAASQESAVGKPLACSVTVTAFSDDGVTQVASQTFSYTVDTLPLTTLTALTAQMKQAVLSSKFKGVKRVNFDVSDPMLTAALVDNVVYTVYSSSPVGK